MTGSRARWFRLAAALGLPLFFAVLVEIGSRVAGYGYPTSFFLLRTIGDRASLVDNQEFGKRFFPPGLVRYPKPMAIPAAKAPGALRIFVLGESAAMGDPEPRFGLPRMLEALLRARYPGRPIEVVTAAMVAINSHVIVPIARECATLQADAWVIYMGNNEMIGPFGCISQFGVRVPPRPLIAANLELKRARLGQLIDEVAGALRARGKPPVEWSGMSLWENQRINPSDPGPEQVYKNFSANLREIVAAGRRAGIPIILCTVATNLRDCAPFASVHGASLAGADLDRWNELYRQGVELEGKADFAGARQVYAKAMELDPHFADAWFRDARCALALGKSAEARDGFTRARDRDALQFRADTRINTIIRSSVREAKDEGISLLDVEALAAQSAPDGLPGRQLFLEHVHYTPGGNYWLSRTVADETVRALGLSSSGPTSDGKAAGSLSKGEWISEDACLEALGFSSWKRHQMWTLMLERVEQPPFTRQVNHEEQQRLLKAEIDQSRAASKPAQMQRSARQVAQVVQGRPDDPDLRWNLAELLDTLDDVKGAETEWRAVMQRLPQASLPPYNLGRLLETHGRVEDSIALYQQSLAARADYFEARLALGGAFVRAGKHTEGIRELTRAVRQKPASVPARLALGNALRQAARSREAADQFRRVLELEPGNEAARNGLSAITP